MKKLSVVLSLLLFSSSAFAQGYGNPPYGNGGSPVRWRSMVGVITKHLKKGARIRMTGLGILQVRKRPARMGRNPATGEAIKIKASKKIAFRAAKDLKEAI